MTDPSELRAPLRLLLLLLIVLPAVTTPLVAGGTRWAARHFDASGFVLAADGVSDDGTPIVLTSAPSRLDERLEIHTIYLRGTRSLSILRTYPGAGEMRLEVRTATERLRARLRPASDGGARIELDLPDGRGVRAAVDGNGNFLVGEGAALLGPEGDGGELFELLRRYREDVAALGTGAIGGPWPLGALEITGDEPYDRCVTSCSIDCDKQCAFECAMDPFFSCVVCNQACGLGCAIGCQRVRRKESSAGARP